MRGSIYGVVAMFIGLAVAPAIISSGGDTTGNDIAGVLEPFGTILGVATLLAGAGLLLSWYTDSF